jgi:hypothetical protein
MFVSHTPDGRRVRNAGHPEVLPPSWVVPA